MLVAHMRVFRVGRLVLVYGEAWRVRKKTLGAPMTPIRGTLPFRVRGLSSTHSRTSLVQELREKTRMKTSTVRPSLLLPLLSPFLLVHLHEHRRFHCHSYRLFPFLGRRRSTSRQKPSDIFSSIQFRLVTSCSMSLTLPASPLSLES